MPSLTASRFGGAQVKRTGSNQSISNSTWTSISFDTEQYDDASFFDSGTPTRLTISATGLYLVTFTSNFARNATGIRGIRVYANGTTAIVSDQRNTVPATWWSLLGISQVSEFSSGDYIEAQQYQTSGGALNVEVGTGGSSADQQPRFSIARLA